MFQAALARLSSPMDEASGAGGAGVNGRRAAVVQRCAKSLLPIRLATLSRCRPGSLPTRPGRRSLR